MRWKIRLARLSRRTPPRLSVFRRRVRLAAEPVSGQGTSRGRFLQLRAKPWDPLCRLLGAGPAPVGFGAHSRRSTSQCDSGCPRSPLVSSRASCGGPVVSDQSLRGVWYSSTVCSGSILPSSLARIFRSFSCRLCRRSRAVG